MLIDIKLPGFGESITEGTVGIWLKQTGDTIALNEPLLEITTDKITAEVPAPAAGILAEILIDAGATVPVGTVIGRILASSERDTIPVQLDQPTQHSSATMRNNLPISPVVAKLAAEHHLDLAQIAGTGIGGRISKQDVLRFLANAAPTPIVNNPAFATPIDQDQELLPLSSMRRAIAEHMARSVRDIPQATTVFEIDFGRVVADREQQLPSFAQQGIRLTYTSYVVHAVAQALCRVPILNGRYTAAGIVSNRRVHIGVAIALEEGLVVPVIRDANQQNLHEIARILGDLTERARTNRLTPDEMQGGTFSISNHGVGGSVVGTPIINQQQAGILGVGAIVKRAVVLEQNGIDAIAIRPIGYLALTFDHRVCDGADADRFLREVKRVLEGNS
jgi:2-oxoglutarate dehydrogenase E2 component (dihydrolipoamide succinyltransferase)